MRWLLLLGLLVSLNESILAQVEIEKGANLWLSNTEYKNSSDFVHCYIQAPEERLLPYLSTVNAVYYSSFRGFHKIGIQLSDLTKLSGKTWCSNVRFEYGVGEQLIDTSKINTRADLVHKGLISGHPAYTGKDVIMGFVDTGIDFDHPDFKDKNGQTRILKIWDQNAQTDSTLRSSYGYGEVYDSVMINAGSCPHTDNNGHGTQVAGIGAGNGLSVHDSIADYRGYAPECDILIVETDFSRPNWTMSIAEAVEWMFLEADKLGKPIVVNLSVGTYLGSHDGNDLAAQYIDSLVNAKPGRFVVSAAGNAGSVPPFHLRTKVLNDTSFTYFRPNPRSSFGNAIFIEGWADSLQAVGLKLGFGHTNTSSWRDSIYSVEPVQSNLGKITTIKLAGTTELKIYKEKQGDVYLFQYLLLNPGTGKLFKLQSTGKGQHDIWSVSWLGTSDILVSGLPTATNYPMISKYQFPDTNQTIVSSWNCSPNVISVGNYNNRYAYLNTQDSLRVTVDFPIGGKGASSSRGPNRKAFTKPDIMAPGNFTLASGRLKDLNFLKNSVPNNHKLAKGDFHFANGGTSMASPVVAGIVALYFEKCPTASAAEVRSALKSNAYSDQFTGTLPNNVFGYGKVDAFNVLTSSNIPDSLLASSRVVLCPGDSVNFKLNGTYSGYSWKMGGSNGTTYTTNNSDTIFVKYWNASGCSGVSDTLITKSVVAPQVQIQAKADSFCLDATTVLKATGAFRYTWNGAVNDSLDSLVVSAAGAYFLKGVDSNQCIALDTIFLKQYLCAVGMEEEAAAIPFNIYPNPVSNSLQLMIPSGQNKSLALRLYSLKGKLLWSENVSNKEMGTYQILNLNMEGYDSGMYLLHWSNENAKGQYRVVKL